MMTRFFWAGVAVTAAVGALWGAASDAAGKAASRVLFDGTSTDAWRGFKRDAFPTKGWVVENGTLKPVVGGDRVDLVTKDVYKDFDLELEWKVGPAGNSGVMYDVAETDAETYHTGPEMQVLDDAGHKDGQNPKTSAGALYALIAPKAKVLKPAGEWNQARLVKKGNDVEHWLNGTKIVEYELGSPALAALIADSKFKDMPHFAKQGQGHIVLQHHGDPAWFRNVRITGTPVKAAR
jgi:3-keto-disaccharide hydrolase